MPRKAPRPCRDCKRATTNTHGYCDDHQDLAVGWVQRQSSWQGKGSTTAWRKKREAILLRDDHLCQICLRDGLYVEARIVDHIVPRFEGGSDDDDNLQSICSPCDKVKTAAESARGRRRRAPRGG
jgi:5-methylcytosine-specific restriction enzyme A